MSQSTNFQSTGLPSDGETIDAADVNTTLVALINDYNLQVGNDKIADDAVTNDKIADDAVTNDKIADDAVTNDKLSLAWADWTPVFTNLSGGTLNYAKYVKIGNTVHFRLKYTLGGAGVGSAPTITLPVATSTNFLLLPIGNAILLDNGVGYYSGDVVINNTTTFRIWNRYTVITWLASTDITAISPFTWTSDDVIYISGTYDIN